ncbi:MAG: hypothetical protein K0B05_12395 [Bacteroidales bacterium]|nr:hypothetical protein [Bacteroidales bacterium]
MKGKLIYFLLFLIVILVVIFLVRNRSPFGRSNISFAVDPGREITAIELNDGEKRLLLERKGDEWLINGSLAARKSSIHFITAILMGIRIKSPVSEELYKAEVAEKELKPVRVRVYGRSRTIGSFYVYKTGSNTYGNIMKIRERSKPFIVHLPGYEGEIGSAFTLNELYWQPYTVFNILPSEIASVKLENFRDTTSSFTIRKNVNLYTLSDHSGELAGWDTSRIARYLSYFIRIPFERWAFEAGTDDSRFVMPADQPVYRITVNRTDGSQKSLIITERIINENGIERTDSDRVLGQTENHDDSFIMRYFDLDPILKKKSYFFPD